MKKIFLLTLLINLQLMVNAQTGIGTTSPNSMLDVRGSLAVNYRAVTGAITLAGTDYSVEFTGTTAITLTLPTATTCQGRIYCIKNGSATLPTPVLTISTTSSQTIDGATSWILDEPKESVAFVSTGTAWQVLVQVVPVAKTNNSGGAWNKGGNRVVATKSIGSRTAFDLPFITNNVERMRLTSAGNLGLGTSVFNATNPEKLLVDLGSTTSVNAISGKGSIDSYLQLNIQNKSDGNSASSDVVATADNGTESVNYVDMGINSSTYNDAAYTISEINDTYLYSAGNDFSIGNAIAGKDLKFFTGGTLASNEQMRIKANGNVGIGVNPTNRLHLYEATGSLPTSTTGTFFIEHGNTGGLSSVVFRSKVNYSSDFAYISYADDASGNGSNSDNNLFTFGIENDVPGVYEDDIAIMPSGRLGIKTTTPGAIVDIQTVTTSGIGLFVGNRTPYGQAMVEIDPGNVTGTIFWCGKNSTELFSVTTSAIRGYTAYTNFSDKRLKKNISYFDTGLHKTMQLQPVTYKWKSESLPDRTELGLIAQDVQAVIPETVTGDSTKESLAIAYTSLLPVLINAIKEQQKQLQSLKADNVLLREAYENLKEEQKNTNNKKSNNEKAMSSLIIKK